MFFCVLAIFCFYQTTAAQSGRKSKNDAPPVEQKAPQESKAVENEKEMPKPKDETPVRISSLIVVGEVQHNFTYYNSNQIDTALKECVRMLKASPKSVSKVARGSGKISYKASKELAEKETDTFVLWLGFLMKDDGYGNAFIESVQYAVLTPKTAKIVTRGEIDPAENKIVTSGGVLQNPPGRKNAATALLQMKQGARKIAEILLRGGWLD